MRLKTKIITKEEQVRQSDENRSRKIYRVNNIFLAIGLSMLLTFIDGYVEWEFPKKLELRVEIKTSVNAVIKCYMDTGEGYSESESARSVIYSGDAFQTVRFPLKVQTIYHMRLDPLDRGGDFSIRDMKLYDNLGFPIRDIATTSLRPNNQIQNLRISKETLHASTSPGANDPSFEMMVEYPISFKTVCPMSCRFKKSALINFEHSLKVFCVSVIVFISGLFMFPARSI
jgi:hypothetical protein